MKLLLDAHIFLWLQTDPDRLGEDLPLIEDTRTELLFSAVSSWEIAISISSASCRSLKHRNGGEC